MQKNLIALATVDNNFAIGKGGEQTIILPDDIKLLDNITKNGTVIMGAKTLNSTKVLPPRGKKTVVLSKRLEETEGVTIYRSIQELLDNLGQGENFVFGGASIFEQLLPYCKNVMITHVDTEIEKPNVYFPDLRKMNDWKMISSSELFVEKGFEYRHELWTRVAA